MCENVCFSVTAFRNYCIYYIILTRTCIRDGWPLHTTDNSVQMTDHEADTMIRRFPNSIVALVGAGMVLVVLSYIALNPASNANNAMLVPKMTVTDPKIAHFMHFQRHSMTVYDKRNISTEVSQAVSGLDDDVDVDSSSSASLSATDWLNAWLNHAPESPSDDTPQTPLVKRKNQSTGIDTEILPDEDENAAWKSPVATTMYATYKDYERYLQELTFVHQINEVRRNFTSNSDVIADRNWNRAPSRVRTEYQNAMRWHQMRQDQAKHASAVITVPSSKSNTKTGGGLLPLGGGLLPPASGGLLPSANGGLPPPAGGGLLPPAGDRSNNNEDEVAKHFKNTYSSRWCTPVKNIVFFKTHKCATTTVQNILFRYGDGHQLKFVLPKSKKDHRFSLRFPFNRRQVLTSGRGIPGKGMRNRETFNIFTNHAIFNQDEIEALMPSDSIYITILRDPSAMYESMYTYLRLDHGYSPDGGQNHLVSIEEFLDNAPKYYNNRDSVYAANFSRNPMLYDFGLKPEDMDDVSKIDNLISIIDKRFDLVMIADYFEESLIMMKTLLCLELRDVAHLTMNARSGESVHRVGDSLAKKIRSWNWGDVRLFDHFNRTFHAKLERFNSDQIRREKRQLEYMNDRLKKQCVADVAVDMDEVWHPDGVKIKGYVLKDQQLDNNADNICQKVTRSEIMYTNILKKRQSGWS